MTQFSEFRRRVDTKAPSPVAGEMMAKVRDLIIDTGLQLSASVPDGPDKQKMLDALELAKYHANTAIIVRDNQLHGGA